MCVCVGVVVFGGGGGGGWVFLTSLDTKITKVFNNLEIYGTNAAIAKAHAQIQATLRERGDEKKQAG